MEFPAVAAGRIKTDVPAKSHVDSRVIKVVRCFGRLRGWGTRIVTMTLALSCIVALANVAIAAVPEPGFTPYQVEAAYLFNFARFVEWPAQAFTDPEMPMIIGILGKDPFGPLLDDVVRGEKVAGRPIIIRRFNRVQEVDRCHILFVARSEDQRLDEICRALRTRHVLTVSDIDDFAKRGGIIELVNDNRRIRFRIALGLARAELLEISAKLLRPADIVSRVSPGQLYTSSDGRGQYPLRLPAQLNPTVTRRGALLRTGLFTFSRTTESVD